jgi:hypothetical protein
MQRDAGGTAKQVETRQAHRCTDIQKGKSGTDDRLRDWDRQADTAMWRTGQVQEWGQSGRCWGSSAGKVEERNSQTVTGIGLAGTGQAGKAREPKAGSGRLS